MKSLIFFDLDLDFFLTSCLCVFEEFENKRRNIFVSLCPCPCPCPTSDDLVSERLAVLDVPGAGCSTALHCTALHCTALH